MQGNRSRKIKRRVAMGSEKVGGAPWERVASELRACKESQQHAWGDIDNTTLGRYLAGEVSGAERQQIEQALQERPELRKLTDLVRDVLAEFEPVPEETPPPVAVPRPVPSPTILPFPGAGRPARRSFLARVRRRAPLVAAAAILLTIGLALPRPGWAPDPGAGRGPHLTRTTASLKPLPGSGPEASEGPMQLPADPTWSGDARLAPMARLDGRVADLDKQGRRREALALTRKYAEVARSAKLEQHPRYAASLNSVGMLYAEAGDLAQAEKPICKAHAICERSLGPTHPATVQTVRNLAVLYRVALNTPAPAATTFSYLAADNPYALSTVPAGRTGERIFSGKSSGGFNPYRASSASGYWAPPGRRLTSGRSEVAFTSAVVLRERITSQSPAQVKRAVVPVLQKGLEEATKPEERAAFARALGNLGPVASAALPVLMKCFKGSSDPAERRAILFALGELGPAARPAVPLLLAALEGKCPVARRSAAEALVHLGAEARTALARDLKQKKGDCRLIREVLKRLQGQEGRIGITDAGECFSIRALRQSLRDIQTLARKGGAEVKFETVGALDSAARKRMAEAVRQMSPRGVHILIARDGASARIQVGESLHKQGLTAEKVATCVQARFRKKEYDRGLADTVRFVARFGKTKP
jgi:hypothetical protein